MKKIRKLRTHPLRYIYMPLRYRYMYVERTAKNYPEKNPEKSEFF